MSSINKRPDIRDRKGRQDFDLSQRQLFTSSVGQCLPVYYDMLNAGETVHMDSALFTRTQTLSSSAMTRLSEHIDYFFIPWRRIWSNFNQWYTQMEKDIPSTLLQFASTPQFPSIDLADIINHIPTPDGSMQRGTINSAVYSDDFGILYKHNASRLLDLLGYGVDTINRFQNQSDFRVSPALLCAYHAVNKDFYRLDDRFQPDADLSNMDNYVNTPPSWDILQTYYRPWKRDFYTNLEISPLFGGYQSPLDNLVKPVDYATTNDISLRNIQGYTSITDQINATSGSFNHANNYSNLDALRRAAAQERLAQLMRFNKKFWNVQLSAMFGVDVPDNYDHVFYLGSHHNELRISDVVGTATTDESVLGEIAGKGISTPNGQQPIKFTAPQPGFIMAIYSAVPEADYIAYGLDRINTYMTLNSFYRPQFDNLSMQPKFAYESNYVPDGSRNSVVLGWTYRWQELKSKPDLAHGAFTSSLRNWVTSRSNQTQNISYSNFCISPKYLDSIMLAIFGLSDVAGSEETAETDFKNQYIADPFGRDPLLHQLYFKVLKLSGMSKFSLPQHNSVML